MKKKLEIKAVSENDSFLGFEENKSMVWLYSTDSYCNEEVNRKTDSSL